MKDERYPECPLVQWLVAMSIRAKIPQINQANKRMPEKRKGTEAVMWNGSILWLNSSRPFSWLSGASFWDATVSKDAKKQAAENFPFFESFGMKAFYSNAAYFQVNWPVEGKSKLAFFPLHCARPRWGAKELCLPTASYRCGYAGSRFGEVQPNLIMTSKSRTTTITNCAWYLSNSTLHKDLNLYTVKAQMGRHTSRCSGRLLSYSSLLARRLIAAWPLRRLKRQGYAKTIVQQ